METVTLLRRLWRLVNRDVTGRTWVEESHHPYFGRLTRFCHRDRSKDWWEADVEVPSLGNRIGVTIDATETAPSDGEVAFCRSAVSDLDALFSLARSAFEPVFYQWTKHSLPPEWRGSFDLDGFSVPKAGNPKNAWQLCFYVREAHHNFTAEFEGGRVVNVLVDG